jgi:serine/threonine protein kinase
MLRRPLLKSTKLPGRQSPFLSASRPLLAMQHGRYTVNRKLAEGGMAEIFLAKQHGSQGFEKPVVLKRIHAALYADEQFRNMLIDEAHISMGLMHNNIVQILDLGQAGGRYFLVLELIEGWDLGRLIRRASDLNVAIPPELGLYVVAQICRALGYAHSKLNPEGRPLGIVHRDVSPQNVLISEQGDVKLADFGIAKARRKRESTDTGVVKGKIAFMSPEQALGQELDARSDLYSLGTLLYLLVIGRRPFEGATDLEILLRVQKGELTPPATLKPDLHPAVIAVIERAMQFDRNQRYGTADEMLADIEGALRSAFSGAGQTELKHWLAELARIDGELPIGRHVLGAPTDSLEGEAAFESGDDLVLVEDVEPTLLHEPPSRKERLARMTGAEATVADLRISPKWIDQESPAAIRSTAPSRVWSFGVMLVIATALAASAAGIWRATKKRNALLSSQTAGATESMPVADPKKDAVVPKTPSVVAGPEVKLEVRKEPPSKIEEPREVPVKTESAKPERKPIEPAIETEEPPPLPERARVPTVTPPSAVPAEPVPVPTEPIAPLPSDLAPTAPTATPVPAHTTAPAPNTQPTAVTGAAP